MPVDRSTKLSVSQFSELLGIEPKRFIDVEVNRQTSTVTVVLEPEETADGPNERRDPTVGR